MIKSNTYNKIKKEVYSFLEPHEDDRGLKKSLDYFMVILILLNTISVMMETVASFEDEYRDYLYAFEIFSIIIFTIEYVLRIWSITYKPNYSGSILGRIKYIVKPTAIIDLFSILPFFLYSI